MSYFLFVYFSFERTLCLDSQTRAKLMKEMLKDADNLPPEERQKLLEKMLENSDQLGK